MFGKKITVLVGGVFNGSSEGGETGLAGPDPEGPLDAGFNVNFLGNIMKLKFLVLGIVFTLFSFNGALAVRGQSVDLTFNASPGRAIDNNVNISLANAPGGKYYALMSGVVYRLNGDGSLDNTFNCYDCFWGIGSMVALPDGKVLVAGAYGGGPVIWRLNTDGSFDSTFSTNIGAGTVPFGSEGYDGVVAAAPDGKIYATISFGGLHLYSLVLYRLNPSGQRDTTFTPSSYGGWSLPWRLSRITPLPDGKLLVAGDNNFGNVFRLNADGTKDTSLEAPALTRPQTGGFPPPSPTVNGAVQLSDGKVVFAGLFDSANGLPRISIAKLDPAGTVDSSISNVPLTVPSEADVRAQSTGKLILSAAYNDGYGLRRLNADLSIDNTFTFVNTSTPLLSGDVFMDSADRLIVRDNNVYKRFTADGVADPTFTLGLHQAGEIKTMAALPDGKVIVSGDFSFMGDAARNKIARVNVDGSNDTSFDPGTGFDVAPFLVMMQPDSKIIALGAFNNYNGTGQAMLVRINTDGSRDAVYNPTIAGFISAAAVQKDGKLLLGGTNMTINGAARTGLVRLNMDGTTDASFNPAVVPTRINGIIAQNDNKIVFGGLFAGVNGANRSNLARLNADGTLDSSFNAGSITEVGKILRLTSGKYSVLSSGVRRLNVDGSGDTSFTVTSPSASNTFSWIEDSYGGIILGGNYDHGSFQGDLSRIKPNGGQDTGFFAYRPNQRVNTLVKQATGKIIAGGAFTNIEGKVRPGIARLNITTPAGAFYDFDGDGKADPSVTRPSDYVWHQLSTAGGYTYSATPFGQAGDKIAPGDYDGDGRTDIGIYRPSTGDWLYKSSVTGNFASQHNGDSGDTVMPSDTDGDGKTDMVVVTPGYVWKGINPATGQLIVFHQFGQAGDKPVIGDFDGDRKFDLAFYRPSTGTWYYNKSSSGASTQVGTVQWGLPTDIPVPADYDGDGITDVAVFRPSEGNWYALKSGGGYIMLHFGATGDKPIAADYDGDGQADIAVYRPSEGFWYELLSTGGYTGYPWGNSTDIPTPNALLQ
jgi:uncharacterized delta-60 repeat protein